MDERRSVGVVLVNYNGMAFMPDCLASLAQIDYGASRLVVVDNASSDGSADWVAAHYPAVALIRLPTNTGVTGGNNRGIEWCIAQGCAYILLLNNDTVVEPDFLSQLMEQAEPQTLVTPKIYFYDNRALINSQVGEFDYWRGVLRSWFYGRPDTPASRELQSVGMANTCALLFSRQLIEQIGLMDEAYFMYYDDTDFVTRAVRSGATVKFVPRAVIYHRESSSSGGKRVSPFTMYYNTRNRLYFMRKHQKQLPKLIFFAAYFVGGRLAALLRYLLRGERGLVRAILCGVADFLRGTTGYIPPTRYS